MRVLIAGVLAGVVMFAANAVSWMVLPFHAQVLKSMPMPREKVVRFLGDLPEGGVFHFPGFPTQADGTPPSNEQIEAVLSDMRRGPVVSKMVFVPAGVEPFPPQNFAIGLGVNIAAAFLAAWMLSRAAPRIQDYLGRVMFVFGFGWVIFLSRFVPEAMWWNYPLDYAATDAGDILVPWLLAGLVIAAVVQKPRIEEIPAAPVG